MLRSITAAVFLIAAVGMLWMPSPPTHVSTSMSAAVEAGLGCGCPKGLRCCYDCSGHLLCVRSIQQCPECPAP